MNNAQNFEVIKGELCKYFGSEEEVAVPEGVRVIGACAFAENDRIRNVFLPQSVVRISQGAFRKCINLEEIRFSEELIEIEALAFCGCEKLTEIHLPEKLKFIGERAFSSCKSLTSVHLPESVQTLGERAFSACVGLRTVRFSSGLEEIPRAVFSECYSLVDVQLPTLLKSIGKSAFIYTKGLNLRLPESLQSIGSRAFESTRSFNVLFPKHFTSLPNYLFEYAGDYEIFAPGVPFSSLSSRDRKAAVAGYVKAPEDMLAVLPKEEEAEYLAFLRRYRKKYYSRMETNEALLIKMIEHRLIPYQETEELLSVLRERPDLIAMLLNYRQSLLTPELEAKLQREKQREEERLFSLVPPTLTERKKEWRFEILENDTCVLHSYKGSDSVLEIPAQIGKYDVVAIAARALSPMASRISERQCAVRKQITSITVPDTVKTLGDCAFIACIGLKTAILPKNITKLPKCVFAHCEKLTSVQLPEALETILDYAFLNCPRLTELILPDHLTHIDPSAFEDCKYLTLKVRAETQTQSLLREIGIPYEIID